MPYYAPPTAATANLPYFDLRDYGAAQNGTTDDATALTAALAAANTAGGGTVMISGVVAVSSEIQVPTMCGISGPAPYGGEKMSGGPFAKARIKPTAAATSLQSIVYLSDRGAYLWNCSVDANHQAQAAVRTGASYGNWIQGCELFNGTEFALWNQSQDLWVSECKFNMDCRGSTLYNDDGGPNGTSPDSRFIGCHFVGGNGIYGNVWSKCSNEVFTSCHVYPGGNMSGGGVVGDESTPGAITAASSGSPINITTTNNHQFANGNVVYIRSVTGNTNANYSWTVANKTAKTFDLLNLQYADISNGSNVVTNLLDTTQLAVGAGVTGTGIPAATTISAITSGTALTLTNNATSTKTQGASTTSGGVLLTFASKGNAAYVSGGAVALAGSSFGYHIQDCAYNQITGGSYIDGEKHPNFRDVLIRTTGSNTSRRHRLHGIQFHNDNDTVVTTGALGAGNGAKYGIELRNSNSGGTISGIMVEGCDASGSSTSNCNFAAFLLTGALGNVYNTMLVGCTGRYCTTFYSGARPATLIGCTSYTGTETSAEVTPTEPVGTFGIIQSWGQSTATLAASSTYLFPFYNPEYKTFTNVGVRWQAAGTGNVDVGIYDFSSNPAQLAHVGSTAAATAQLSKSYSLSVPYKAAPGWYQFGISTDATQTIFGSTQLVANYSNVYATTWSAGLPSTLAATAAAGNNSVGFNFTIT